MLDENTIYHGPRRHHGKKPGILTTTATKAKKKAKEDGERISEYYPVRRILEGRNLTTEPGKHRDSFLHSSSFILFSPSSPSW
jgi:hypothetical protein